MLNSKITIEIVRSSEPGLSSISQKAADAIYPVLARRYRNVRISLVNNIADLEGLVARSPDLVFLGIKFIPKNYELGLSDPDKIWISEYLDARNITYTGSSCGAVELELDKSLAKQRVINANLKTPKYYIAKQSSDQNLNNVGLNYPIFVKPISRGGGLGIDSYSVVNNHEELNAKVQTIATNLRSDSLLEEYLPGREFSVAILKDEYSNDYSIMPIELISPKHSNGLRFLTGKVKKDDTETSIAVPDIILKSKINLLAIDVFNALGARDFGRIDIRLDAKGVPHFLEANLLPSLTDNPGNYFPKACRLNIEMDYEEVILTIVRLALARKIDEYQNLSKDILINNIFEPFPVTALDPV